MIPTALVMVADDLNDDASRVGAAAGFQLVRTEPSQCRRAWAEAAAVIVDVAAAQQVLLMALPKRVGVIVVGPPGGELAAMWRMALNLGAVDALVLPDDEHAIVQALSRTRSPRGRPGEVVAIVGGCGGAGATTLAAAVALSAARQGQALLIDLDELGGGIDLLLGLEDEPGLRWDDLTLEGGRVMADALHSALPGIGGNLAVLAPSRAMPAEIRPDAVLATIDAGRGHGDVVVIDTPRRDDALTAAVWESADLVVIVVPATVRGCAAGRELVGRVQARTRRHATVVRGPSPGGLTGQQVADAAGSALLHSMRSDAGLSARIEGSGLRLRARSPLSKTAAAVLNRLTGDRQAGAA